MLKKTTAFISEGIWNVALQDLKGVRALGTAALRAAVLAARVFIKTQCTQKSSALTFFTLLSIVPVAALVFGIAKGFGVENLLERRLLANLQGQEEAVRRIIDFARNLIKTMRGGVIAGIGIAVLLWTVVKMLGNIEDAFNAIWGIQRSRPLTRKFSDYLSAMLICPILAIMAGSLTVTIASQARVFLSRFPLLESAGPALAALLGFLPYVFAWVLFSFLYVFMPNTRVRFVPGIVAGIVAGTAYQLMQWVYIKFQIGIAGYNAVYGGFAALPLFLAWLQTSWTIVLFGAALSWACQEARSHDYDTGTVEISHSQRRLLALLAATAVVHRFESAEPPPTAQELSARLRAPLRVLKTILSDLVGCGILVSMPDGYRPARSTSGLTITAVTEALDACGASKSRIADCPGIPDLEARLASFRRCAEAAPDNILLKDLKTPP